MSILNAPILPLMAAVKEGMRDTWGGGWDGNKWTGTNGGIPKNSRSSGICSEGNVPVREGGLCGTLALYCALFKVCIISSNPCIT